MTSPPQYEQVLAELRIPNDKLLSVYLHGSHLYGTAGPLSGT